MFRLTAAQIDEIHSTSLRILEHIGVRLDDVAVRELTIRQGALPGHTNDVIRLPNRMVREFVSMAPRFVRLSDCQGRTVEIGPNGDSTFWTGAALNYKTRNECRPITREDLTQFARVADRLDTVFAVTGTSIAEVPPICRDIVGLRIIAENSRKHLRPLLFDPRNVKPMIEMAQIIGGGSTLREHPLISFGYSCLSPLHWSKTATDLWRESSGHGIPVMINGEPVAGATSPVTLAGSLALSNAEILAGVVLIQLLEPGRPVIHNLGFAHVTDMRTGGCLSGAAECALMAAAGAQMAAFYGLPSASWMGTDSLTDDPQASLEKALTGYAHLNAGVNIIWGMGQLESQKTLSPVQLLIDHEITRWLLRMKRGFSVDQTSLAYEVIREVIEQHGEFLSHDHTVVNFRTELSESALLVRTNRGRWEVEGRRGIVEKAEGLMLDLLKKPHIPALNDTQLEEIQGIEKKALRRLGL
ncbi:MAG: trimethylamine methyltransferase family protein [Kiritimatiellae bacterium]|nr:trimethylamine methyltransferase family protein [Kiritimatiellia bacterium]